MKVQISAWNFADIKCLIRIVYSKNFRSFGFTLTEIRILENIDGLYRLSYIISKINLSPFFIDKSK